MECYVPVHAQAIDCGFLWLLVAACGASNASPPEHASEPVWTGAVDEDAFMALHQLTDAEAPPLRGEMIPVGDSSGYLSW